MKTKHLDIHIEADFGSGYQYRLWADVMRAMAKNWKAAAESTHKQTVITVVEDEIE